jgi:AcrR family transcriptional regulator
MPPKQSITKEMIIEAAFSLVREKGMAALSARNIARQLNCSTQPVYSCFSSMKDLEAAVIKKASNYIEDTYLVSSTHQENNFLSIGLGYVQMAKNEKHLFDLLYLSGNIKLDFEHRRFPVDAGRLINTMRKDAYFNMFTKDELFILLTHMWIYTHGLTTLARSNPAISDEFIHKSIEEMGFIVITQALEAKGGLKNETNCFER